MAIPQTELEINQEVVSDPANVFHRVNNVLPEDQDPLFISYNTPVSNALSLMQENNYSQLIVTTVDEVLGVFSYKSFASKLPEILTDKVDLEALPVGEFIEQIEFVHIFEDIANTIEILDRKETIFVGSPMDFKGILTPIDLVKYLYRQSKPFFILGEIELALRFIIGSSVDTVKLKEIMNATLSQLYEPTKMPATLEDMTFNDYVQVIGDGRTWEHFSDAFGGGGTFQRKRTRAKLESIRDIRNVVFHFRRELQDEELRNLVSHRNWIKNVVSAYKAMRAVR